MKNKLIMSSIAAGIVFVACGGRVVVDGLPNETGGEGGAAGGGTTGPNGQVGSASIASSGSIGGSGGTGMGTGGSCVTCAAFVSGLGTQDQLCVPDGIGFFKELLDCACFSICKDKCAKSACISPNFAPDDQCSICLTDTSLGCGFELKNCATH